MPDEYDDPEDPDESGVIRDLRRQAKKADEAVAERDALRTELAFAKAGLDLTPERQKALLAVHNGEATPEGFLATAALLGFSEAQAATPEEQVPADEVAAQQRAQEAMAGAEAADAHVVTTSDRIAAASSPEEIISILNEAGITTNFE